MSGLISISSSGGGSNNASPIISNLRVDGKINTDRFTIKYTATDSENTILRHYISINGKKKEITKELGYESSNNEFTYNLNDLQNNTNYNVQIEVTDGVNVANSSIDVKTLNFVVYGIKVMENNSNSSTCCTYIEDSADIDPATPTSLGGWADKWPFNKIRIVGFKDGKVVKEIKKEDKTKYVDGTTVNSDVDVMVEIPRVFWKFTNITNGYELRISNAKVDSSYGCYAHKVGGVEKDYIYVGTYLGYNDGGKLRSKSGVSPTISTSLTQFRTYAHNVGNGYQQFNWFTLILLQNLYLIAYKNLNSQNALGQGVCKGSKTNTGGTNSKGFVYGSQNQTEQMCFLGIEDFWGNLFQWIDGMKIDSSYNILVTPDNKDFNDDANGYKNVGKLTRNNGYISKVIHTNEGGYFAKECSGSATTYYGDNSTVSSGHCARFGGHNTSGSVVGAFYLDANYYPYGTGAGLSSRLVFLG